MPGKLYPGRAWQAYNKQRAPGSRREAHTLTCVWVQEGGVPRVLLRQVCAQHCQPQRSTCKQGGRQTT